MDAETAEIAQARTFFGSVHRLFTDLESDRREARQFRFEVGGYCICLRFVSGHLVPIYTPALAHLQTDKTDPDLTVCIWDGVSTGTPLPPVPWGLDDCTVRGEVKRHNSPALFTVFQASTGILSMLDPRANLALYWITDPAILPQAERGSPLLTTLHWWLGCQRLQLAHAAAVGDSRGALLLAGKGGTGKSSTTLSCLLDGMSVVGDDYCVIQAEPDPIVHSIYSTAKVSADQLPADPDLEAALGNALESQNEKALLYLHPQYSSNLLRQAPIRALLLPRVAERPETTVVAASAGEAVRALAPSTLFQLSRTSGRSFSALAALARAVPCYHLRLGQDRSTIAPQLRQLLAELT